MRALLDSNAYTQLENGEPAVSKLVREAETILLSMIVVGELLAAFRQGTRLEGNLTKLREFLARPRVETVPVTWATAERFGRIMSALRHKGRPIPTNDVWIAAHAMETGADLISFDQHFAQVDGLAWIDPSR